MTSNEVTKDLELPKDDDAWKNILENSKVKRLLSVQAQTTDVSRRIREILEVLKGNYDSENAGNLYIYTYTKILNVSSEIINLMKP